jgi:hypothetical protein
LQKQALAEIRRPKDRSPKEGRRSKPEKQQVFLSIRASAFGLLSGFGFRISPFCPLLTFATGFS